MKRLTGIRRCSFINKKFDQLKKGDRFIASVVDIRPDYVTIRLQNGGLFSFKSLVLPNARIGEDAAFIVRENINGKIQLEMAKAASNSRDFDETDQKKHRYFDMRL